ncbi:uncharacterized protein ATNIH1004_008512 [Aspergillus tanneri]|uniref:CHY-type domain-containing protein n=1 Tax=Aspergillus tanneri TaxID=1220188 RepID=A0A5M9MBS4_9EURO|nr:uncharacterized protein ATNIH1004_008512 [Aspergillus tanneri]KAA8644311.1 hypothetical protein ATNIH1004_008512 [Aspergillus tanneri]
MNNPGSNGSQRPISKAESATPREFQINQLRRRFRPTECTDEYGTIFTFGLAPSDPDFPFELDKLQCILHVPSTYPAGARPTLKVTNPEMGQPFRDNVARGFDDIVDSTLRSGGRGTLLTWMNTLDRHLERLLTTTERGPTLKFVTNIGSRGNEPAGSQELTEKLQSLHVPLESQQYALMTETPTRVFFAEEKAQVEKRRAMETRQIEARLGRLPLFQKSKDELSFVIPIHPPKAERLPFSLRSVTTVKLLVPRLYPLEPSAVELHGVDSIEARSVEAGFAQWIKGNTNLNLMSQINYLTSNMHNFAKTPLEEASNLVSGPVPTDTPVRDESPTTNDVQIGDKPHLRVVSRPPEWSVVDRGSGSDDTDSYTSEEYSSDEDDDEGGAPVPSLPEPTTERGVALSFPFIELYGIELLDLVGLSITVKCERCKEQMDVKNVPQAKDQNDVFIPKIETCKKCANTMSIGFRRQLIHSHSNRAGYLDLDGCVIADLLPSSFIPTCAECSTSFHAPGVVAVRGESAMAVCRQCHRKMVFKLPEVKFLRVGSAAFTSRDRAPQRKKPKEDLGIVAGQELPRRGRCMHYATDHPNEHANRMICGFCSREQIYRPENCGICRAVLIGKAGSGFWEGGKGTRNKVLMSRKDPRKYKRRPGTTPRGLSKKKDR